MSPHTVQSIYNRLIRRSIDLRQLYRHAARECEPGLRMVLAENAQTLDQLVIELQAHIHESGLQLRPRGSWRGVLHRYFSGWLMRAAPRRDNAWIHALGYREQLLLGLFEDAIAVAPPESTTLLRKQLPRLRAIHMDMHYLGGAPRI